MQICSRLPLIITGLALLLLFLSSLVVKISGIQLVRNFSPSEKKGLYIVRKEETYKRGDLVLIHFPDTLRTLAKERKWLKEGMPLLKRLAAIPGDFVCHTMRRLVVNGRQVAKIKERDRAGRPLPVISGCYKVQQGYFLPLGTNSANSFDGRYFGVVSETQTIGKARSLF